MKISSIIEHIDTLPEFNDVQGSIDARFKARRLILLHPARYQIAKKAALKLPKVGRKSWEDLLNIHGLTEQSHTVRIKPTNRF